MTPAAYVIDGDTVGCFTIEQMKDILILIEQERECQQILLEKEGVIGWKDSIIATKDVMIMNLRGQILNLRAIESTYRQIGTERQDIIDIQAQRIAGLRKRMIFVIGGSSILTVSAILISFLQK